MKIWESCKRFVATLQEIGVVDNDLLRAPKIRFLNTASLIAMVTLGLNFLMDWASGRVYYPIWAFALAFQVSVALVLLSNKLRAYGLARFLFLFGFTTLFLSGNLYVSFIGSENFLFVTLLIAFNILERKISFVLLTLYYAALYSLIVYGMDCGYLTQGDLPRHYYYVNSSLAIMIVALLAYRYSSLLDRQVATMQKLNEDLQKKHVLAHNLLKELNHRVKNNLQIISSLFNLQGNSSDNPETRQALAEARSRINSIAILHQKLYQGDLIFEVDAKDYLQSLCDYLHHSDSLSAELQIDLHAPNMTLQIKETIYLGLMVNELITNALKYARRPECVLHIQLHVGIQAKGELVLEISDNGPGFSNMETLHQSDSFGLGLVRTIVEQYDGAVHMQNRQEGGAYIRIFMQFPP